MHYSVHVPEISGIPESFYNLINPVLKTGNFGITHHGVSENLHSRGMHYFAFEVAWHHPRVDNPKLSLIDAKNEKALCDRVGVKYDPVVERGYMSFKSNLYPNYLHRDHVPF